MPYFTMPRRICQGCGGVFARKKGTFEKVPFVLHILFVHRAVSCASAVVLAFLVHTECIPCCRTINIFFRNVVHANRDTEHRAHCDEVCADVTVGDSAVVCAPVHHHFISRGESNPLGPVLVKFPPFGIVVLARRQPCFTLTQPKDNNLSAYRVCEFKN